MQRRAKAPRRPPEGRARLSTLRPSSGTGRRPAASPSTSRAMPARPRRAAAGPLLVGAAAADRAVVGRHAALVVAADRQGERPGERGADTQVLVDDQRADRRRAVAGA